MEVGYDEYLHIVEDLCDRLKKSVVANNSFAKIINNIKSNPEIMIKEDYEKKYEQLTKFIKDLYPFMSDYCKEKVEGIIPELKESEDEKSKNWILEYLYDGLRKSDEQFKEQFKAAIAWLEKQSKTSWKPSKEEMDVLYGLAYITNEFDEQKEEVITRLYQDLKRVFFNGASFENMFPTNTSEELEKQDNQKPIDEVKPKFKVGDWVVQGCNIFKIRCVGDEYYCFETVGGYVGDMLVSEVDSSYHLWAIQDAKDGDVLANNGNIILFKEISNSARTDYKYIQSHCLILAHSSDFYTGGSYNLDDGFHPATKEQRDTLMKAIADAGYEWDFEVKELNKIEKKPAWSEKDERILKDIICEIEANKYNAPDYDIAAYDKFLSWLESIKDRVQFQAKQGWSEEELGLIWEK